MAHQLPRVERELDVATTELDSLLAEVRLGFRDQRHFDALEEKAERVAEQLRGAFRGARQRAQALRESRHS